MAEVSIHPEVTHGRAAGPFVLRLLHGVRVLTRMLGCVLAVMLFGAAATAASSGLPIVAINSASGSQFAHAGAVAPAAVTQPSFLGYLEFDWDWNAVPGFGPWPGDQHHFDTTPSAKNAMDRLIKHEEVAGRDQR